MVAPSKLEEMVRLGPPHEALALTRADIDLLPAKLQWALAAWLRERRDFEAVAIVLDQIEQRSGETLRLLEERARLAFAMGDLARATALLSERFDRAPSATAWIKRARLALATGDQATALAIGDDLARHHVDLQSVQALTADLALATGDHETVRRHHEAVLQVEPAQIGARLGLARLASLEGDPDRARALLDQVVSEATLTRSQLADAADIARLSGETARVAALHDRIGALVSAEMTTLRDAIADALGRKEPKAAESNSVVPDDNAALPAAMVDDPPLPLEVMAALTGTFGHAALRPGQATVIANVLAGTDTLAIMPTGAGKSLTFQLPAMLLPGVSLVISPLIALMKDQVEGLPPAVRDRTALLNSSLSPEEQREVLTGIASGAYKLIYIAPERLRHHAFLRALQAGGVERVVVDEAHCISLWGHDFRPDYLTIPHALPALGNPPVLAITATATPRMADAIATGFGRTLSRVTLSLFRANLFYKAYKVPNREAKIAKVFEICREERGAGIVYVSSRRDAEAIAALLRDRGVAAVPYHAGLEPDQRAENQRRFMQRQARVVVATVAFGMGIDKADVRFIVHLNPPRSLEAYAQESGRAGRDGQPARCVLLTAPSDGSSLRRVARRDEQSLDDVRRLYAAVQRQATGRWALVDFDRLKLRGDEHGDPDDAADPRITLGILEQAALTRRHPDAPVHWIVRPRSHQSADEIAPAADPLWARFVAWSGLREAGGDGVSVRTVDACAALEITPIALSLLLSERPDVTAREGARMVCLELLPIGGDTAVRVTDVLDRAREVAEQRIRQVVQYAAGDRCRHVMLARHLGEGLAPCRTACDNCTRAATDSPARGRERQEAATRSTITAADALAMLEAVRTLPFALGKTGLSRLVSGSHESRIRADRSRQFGALAHLKKGQIETLIDRLVASAYLDRDLNHEFKIIRLTERGARASESELAALADDTPAARRAEGGARSSLDPDATALLDHLIVWRRERAARDEVPAYVIAHNSVLEAIAASRPPDPRALTTIKGLGPAKIEKYGAEIIAIVAAASE